MKRLAEIEETARAVSSAADELGHDLHPWLIDGNQARTACRRCGATAGLELTDRDAYAYGAATLVRCDDVLHPPGSGA